MVPAISVIISTFDRFFYLDKALASLKIQTYDNKKFEVLVIDAGLGNGTLTVLNKYSETLPIRHIPAPQTGLSESRNIGIQRAAGTILAFLDDDAEADPGWLDEIYQCFFSHHEKSICACGGKSYLVWETESPEWMNDSMRMILGQMDYGDSEFFMSSSHQYPFGLNMAFRKQTFERIGDFTRNLGRSHGTLLSNEETEFFQRMRQNDLGIYYNPKMVVHHHVPAERSTKDYFYNRYFWQGRSDAVMDAGEDFSCRRLFRMLIRSGIFPYRILKAFLFTQYSSGEQRQVVTRCAIEYHRGYLRQITKST
jgi:glucosyl-dolichyl phosphate glucuronosyltransferase